MTFVYYLLAHLTLYRTITVVAIFVLIDQAFRYAVTAFGMALEYNLYKRKGAESDDDNDIDNSAY